MSVAKRVTENAPSEKPKRFIRLSARFLLESNDRLAKFSSIDHHDDNTRHQTETRSERNRRKKKMPMNERKNERNAIRQTIGLAHCMCTCIRDSVQDARAPYLSLSPPLSLSRCVCTSQHTRKMYEMYTQVIWSTASVRCVRLPIWFSLKRNRALTCLALHMYETSASEQAS